MVHEEERVVLPSVFSPCIVNIHPCRDRENIEPPENLISGVRHRLLRAGMGEALHKLATLCDSSISPHNVLGVNISRNCTRWGVADEAQDLLAGMIPACLASARVVAIKRELVDDRDASLRLLKSRK